jgi:hypothetical protein
LVHIREVPYTGPEFIFVILFRMQQMEKMRVLVRDTSQNTSLKIYILFPTVQFLFGRDILLHEGSGIV